ncbi:peptidoglycan-binding domain-containing protein [Streptomyces cadmiisoli]|uniref:Peptidoglycan binding-like domain-containing protein n=1 Tax=Streptomyces cadmiisoli TaxID=2184053 RepID=A0A2Z4IR54_9ACTN|nr:peptidoglycan-binding domain-containing protein [Streptomyces cadmiisoli]AWW35452.1 hypothetical protein DN051_01125 [Streptomyces cadmiisoli]
MQTPLAHECFVQGGDQLMLAGRKITTMAAAIALGVGLAVAGPTASAQAATCSYTYNNTTGYAFAGHYSGWTAVPSKTVVTSSGAEAQCLLKEIGYSITVDGVFGPNSQAVMKEFQRKVNGSPWRAGLAVDGVPGPESWEWLRWYAWDF